MTDLAIDEARQLEAEFLSGLERAQAAYERIVAARAWTALGYDSFTAWWAGRVQPLMRALSMRPTREIAADVVERVRQEEASLPPVQRRTQRELGEMVGESDRTEYMRQTRSRQANRFAQADLESVVSDVVDGELAAQEQRRTDRQALDDLAEELGLESDDQAEAEADARTALLYPLFDAIHTMATMPPAEVVASNVLPYQRYRLDELWAALAWLRQFGETWKEMQ